MYLYSLDLVTYELVLLLPLEDGELLYMKPILWFDESANI